MAALLLTMKLVLLGYGRFSLPAHALIAHEAIPLWAYSIEIRLEVGLFHFWYVCQDMSRCNGREAGRLGVDGMLPFGGIVEDRRDGMKACKGDIGRIEARG